MNGEARTPYAPPAASLHEAAPAATRGMRWLRVLVFAWIMLASGLGAVVGAFLLVDAVAIEGVGLGDADSFGPVALGAGAFATYVLFLWPIRGWRWRFANAAALYVTAMVLVYALAFCVEAMMGGARSTFRMPWALLGVHALLACAAVVLRWRRRETGPG